jgi:thiol:disulfide interchange protein DsbC
MSRLLAAALLGALSISSCAADQPEGQSTVQGGPEANVRAALQTLVPDVKVDRLRPAPVPGFHEVVLSGQVLYVSNDGKYLLQGSLFEVGTRTDLTERARAELRREVLATIGKEQRIVFGPADAKHRVTVFTDIDCGYCRRLHGQIKEYNDAGIAVEYLFFPRAGVGSESYDKAVSVWCATDRHQALTEAKAGSELPKRECSNPVTMEFNLGQRIGVEGTPAVYNAEGVQIGGYLPPDQMLQRLEQLAARVASN